MGYGMAARTLRTRINNSLLPPFLFPPHPWLLSAMFLGLDQVTEKLLEVENETVMKVADLEKQLLQKDKDLVAIRVNMLVRNELLLLL